MKVKQKIEEEESIKHLASAWERAKTSFLTGTRPRLKAQNLFLIRYWEKRCNWIVIF